MTEPTRGRQRLSAAWPVGLLTLAVLVITARRGWLGDDAFITLRVVDNLVAGHGLRWNIAERVQVFTHPLWLFVLAVPYAVTREPYLTTMATSLAVSALAVVAATRVTAGRPEVLAFMGVTMIGSRALMDYGTSGLENPLSHLLLALLAGEAWRDTPRPGRLGLLTAALGLTRLDLLLLAAPIAAGALWQNRTPAAARWFVLGLAPLGAWEAFSVIYFGVPFPNTAYAKLATGIPSHELAHQGGLYLLDSLATDPSTLAAVLLAMVLPWLAPMALLRPASVALLLALVYVVRIGGDFMSGRFLTAPFWLAVLMLCRVPWNPARLVWVPAALLLALSLGQPDRPADLRLQDAGGRAPIPPTGIVDERRYYQKSTGLWTPLGIRRSARWPDLEARVAAHRDAGRRVVPADAIGILGYTAGPELHLVDVMGLSDPLLARLPAARPWRIGHYRRRLPEGYLESLETGENRVVDPRTRDAWTDIELVTRGPIWSAARWRAMTRMW